MSQTLSTTEMSVEQGAVNHPYVTGDEDKATRVELRPSLVTSYQPCAGGRAIVQYPGAYGFYRKQWPTSTVFINGGLTACRHNRLAHAGNEWT